MQIITFLRFLFVYILLLFLVYLHSYLLPEKEKKTNNLRVNRYPCLILNVSRNFSSISSIIMMLVLGVR